MKSFTRKELRNERGVGKCCKGLAYFDIKERGHPD